ncbi:MAG TPA: hypothetical protein VFY04_09570 [Solirubrobacterales bacterium]|nr:hypothetical protein [Solirubrobacterales bacterium]
MRREKLGRGDILTLVAPRNRRGEDSKGNPMYVAEVRGNLYCAIVALDNGELITVYDLRR